MQKTGRKTRARPLGNVQKRKRNQVMESLQEALAYLKTTSIPIQELRNNRLTAEGVKERAALLEAQRVKVENEIHRALWILQSMTEDSADDVD